MKDEAKDMSSFRISALESQRSMLGSVDVVDDVDVIDDADEEEGVDNVTPVDKILKT